MIAYGSSPNGAAPLQAPQHIDQHRLRAAIGLVLSRAGVRHEAADLSVARFLFEIEGLCGALGRQPLEQTDTEIDLLVTPADFLQEAVHRLDLRLGILVVVPIAPEGKSQIENLVVGQHAVNVSVELTAPLFEPAIVADLNADGVRLKERAVVFTQVVRPTTIGKTLDDLAVVGRIAPGACVSDNELCRDTPANVIVPRTNRGVGVVGPCGVVQEHVELVRRAAHVFVFVHIGLVNLQPFRCGEGGVLDVGRQKRLQVDAQRRSRIRPHDAIVFERLAALKALDRRFGLRVENPACSKFEFLLDGLDRLAFVSSLYNHFQSSCR